jgi:hypothetical protein
MYPPQIKAIDFGLHYFALTKWGEKGRVQDFGGGNLKEGDHSGDPDVDGRIILR